MIGCNWPLWWKIWQGNLKIKHLNCLSNRWSKTNIRMSTPQSNNHQALYFFLIKIILQIFIHGDK
ncbi:hypothetical protein MtrunA17_Chr8g0367001 [Medicago truncatula]|uniref:Uncharacterized protein n=1 Tax=Medicago truncatula TaxID=3880 RepID=A0A396GK77_MEDTR|nr:hypothetical protein MtrunA17_Chr8g0367001 [Medicago truncatula]